MVWNSRWASLVFSVVCFVLASQISLVGASGEQPSGGEQWSPEMGRMPSQSRVGTSWSDSSRELKLQFEEDYLTGEPEREVFQKYLNSLGPVALLDYLEIHNPRCHGEAHELGRVIFHQSQDIGLALQTCGNRCTNACMHGVVSEAFGQATHEEVIQQMTQFCAGENMASLHKPGNCAHGIGHALMILTDQDLGKSLTSCSAFPQAGMDYYCATGVFMEYWGALEDSVEVFDPIVRTTMHYPCDTYSEFPAACYRYMLRSIARELEADPKRLTEECLSLEGANQRGCFHGLGAMYSREVADNPSLMPELCRVGTREDQILCIEGVIEKMADFDESQAMAVCATLKGDKAKVCIDGAKGKMYRLDKSTLNLYRPVVGRNEE